MFNKEAQAQTTQGRIYPHQNLCSSFGFRWWLLRRLTLSTLPVKLQQKQQGIQIEPISVLVFYPMVMIHVSHQGRHYNAFNHCSVLASARQET